ncbi:hypothetical protein U9M48_014694 [Paspalum notatum var. saurae]|uniref:Inner centromere protein ARK-binding domain-containing protein n=1 Tax=Paspalum notatum var. saurae TaxID=547442 RepID=A0AAQ3WKZ1_PASNO
MEHLFMQAFERGDWLAAQVQQQADSYSQTLACALLAAGHKPPEWLLPSTTLPQGSFQFPPPFPYTPARANELNGKPIVLTGRQITTPAISSSVFLPLAVPSALSTESGVPNGYTFPESNCTALGTNQHEEQQQEQTSLGQELPEAFTVAKIFSRIQRSRSRQRHIEERLHGGDQAAKSGSCDGMHRSNLGTVGSNRAAASSLFIPCDDVANRAETRSSTGQSSGFGAIQGRSTDLLKCNNSIENQGVKSDNFPSLILENKTICSDVDIGVANNCSVRDSPGVPLPDLSKTNISDSVCHQFPETHLLVEPKKLQFDAVESIFTNPSSKQTGQQQDSGLKSGHLDLSGTNPSSDDPSSSSPQGPHSMGRLLLDHVTPGHLKSDSAPVEQHHKYALESGLPYCTAMDSPNKKPFLTEVSNSMGAPLLPKDAEYIPETDSLGRACPKVNQPPETDASNNDETNCSLVKPLLENDMLHAIEDTERPQNSKSHVSCPFSGPLQPPTQLADAMCGAYASSGISRKRFLGEDGCDHLSKLQINDSNSRCSQGRSVVSPELLPPQNIISTDFCQPSLLSYRIQGNDKHSDVCAAVNAFKSADNELSQEHHLVVRPSLEFNGSIPDVETPLGHPLMGMQNEMLQANPVSDLVNCPSGKLGDDAQVNKAYGGSAGNRNNVPVVPKDMSISSSENYLRSPRRTREMCRTDRNSAASSEKCNEKLQEGKEETSHAEDDAQINANSCTSENIEKMKSSCTAKSHEKKNKDQEDRGHAQDSSVADGVQINGAMSSKRKRTKCQDIVLPCSHDTSPLSPSHQDSIGINVATVGKISGKSQPSGRYFLRSSGFSDFVSLKSETKDNAMNCNMSVANDVQQSGKSSAKLRNRSILSEVALCNSSSAKAQSPCGISSSNVDEEMGLPHYQTYLQNISAVATTSPLPSSSNIAIDSMELCLQKENPYLAGEGPSVTNLRVEHQQMPLRVDEILSQGVVLNSENYSSIDSTNIFSSYALDQHDKQASAPIALFHDKLSYGSDMEVDRRFRSEDLRGCLLSDASIPLQKDDESYDCNDNMPQFESFDFSVPFDSPTTEERTFGTLHDSRQFATFTSDTSKKYNMSGVSGMHPLLASMSGKAANCLFSDDETQRESIDGRITDTFGSSGLVLNAPLFTSDVVPSSSSNASCKQENSEKPLTPAVDKYYLGKLSEKYGSVSDHMGSIPELSCFRIDEDSDIAEENQCQDILSAFVGNQRQSGRKTLQDITGLCQNTGNSASYSIGIMDTGDTDLNAETCSRELDHHPDPRNGDNKKPKQSCVSLVKKGGKMSHSLHSRLSNTQARHTSEANLGKRSKPSNIVTNVASFIPLVKAKVQSTEACVKKDVRVKALEAAEAAKRLEEKKRNEREMRKAAAKLEREKMKQERELKQKQEEEDKKKRDAEMATRKRQRDEEGRREKEKKRKCVEAARKQQKQPMERRHANNKKDSHPKAPDNKELQKNMAETVKGQVNPNDMTGYGDKVTNGNNDDVGIADKRPAIFGSHSLENVPNSIEDEEPYIMTPYKDSDDEDDDFERNEESRRRRKLIPSWARYALIRAEVLSGHCAQKSTMVAEKKNNGKKG